jgi:hypothetical protein
MRLHGWPHRKAQRQFCGYRVYKVSLAGLDFPDGPATGKYRFRFASNVGREIAALEIEFGGFGTRAVEEKSAMVAEVLDVERLVPSVVFTLIDTDRFPQTTPRFILVDRNRERLGHYSIRQSINFDELKWNPPVSGFKE